MLAAPLASMPDTFVMKATFLERYWPSWKWKAWSSRTGKQSGGLFASSNPQKRKRTEQAKPFHHPLLHVCQTPGPGRRTGTSAAPGTGRAACGGRVPAPRMAAHGAAAVEENGG